MSAGAGGCPHGMPSRASCVDCMDEGPVAPLERWQKIGGPFLPRYEGTCANCGDPFAEWRHIQRWDLGIDRTAYTHDDCGEPLYG